MRIKTKKEVKKEKQQEISVNITVKYIIYRYFLKGMGVRNKRKSVMEKGEIR